jgi:hypothetical protein
MVLVCCLVVPSNPNVLGHDLGMRHRRRRIQFDSTGGREMRERVVLGWAGERQLTWPTGRTGRQRC